jgi:hypothetical protein
MIDLKKINYSKFVKHSYSLTILVIAIIAVWFIFFLYNNIYLVIIQAEKILDLKTNTVQEIIKKQKLDEVIIKIDKKNENYNQPQKLNFDPFYPQKTIENSNTTSINETTDSVESEVEVENAINN